MHRSPDHYLQSLKILENTPSTLRHWTKDLPAELATQRRNQKWSINENIGHLLTMESLWIARLDDFVLHKPTLRPWNGTNTDTEAGEFNRQRTSKIIDDFEEIREVHKHMLLQLQAKSMDLKSLLEAQNEIITLADHTTMMAAHDQHHLKTIQNLIETR